MCHVSYLNFLIFVSSKLLVQNPKSLYKSYTTDMQNLKSLYQKLYKWYNRETGLSQKLNSLNSLSLCANFPFSFDSLIWNTNGFVSIYEFCNFNSLIFIDFHSFLSPLSNVYVHKYGLQASSSKGNLLHSSSEKLEK